MRGQEAEFTSGQVLLCCSNPQAHRATPPTLLLVVQRCGISKAATYGTVKSVVEQIDFVAEPRRLRSAQGCREYPDGLLTPGALPESSLRERVRHPVYLKADSQR